jgi:curved DNA-binding protein CbpA
LDKDNTGIMQAINEAKLILLDPEARAKYDKEYLKFVHEKQKRANNNHQRSSNTTEKKDSNKQQYPESSENGYEIQDEELKRWMKNAQKQSVDLAKKTIEDFKGMVAAGAVAAGKEAINVISVQIVLGILFTILVLLYRTCQN